MNDNTEKTAGIGAGKATDAAEAAAPISTPPAESAATKPDAGVYKHVFRKPFEYEGRTYTELTFDFARLTGRDMVAIETEMQQNNEYAIAPEISANYQCKIAARAAKIGSDVLEAMPLNDFNKITSAVRRFLTESGY